MSVDLCLLVMVAASHRCYNPESIEILLLAYISTLLALAIRI